MPLVQYNGGSSTTSASSRGQQKSGGLSSRFLVASGDVAESSSLSAPVRWVAEWIQRLVALLLLMLGKALQQIVTKGPAADDAKTERAKRQRNQQQAIADAASPSGRSTRSGGKRK